MLRRAGRAVSLCPQPPGRMATWASPASRRPPRRSSASRSTLGRTGSPGQAPPTQGPFAQRTEPLRCSHGPHRSQPPLPVQVETGVPGGSGGWDPALSCAPFRRIEPFSGRAVGLQRWTPSGSGPCPPLWSLSLPRGDMGTREPSCCFPRGPGSLVSSAGAIAATPSLLPVLTQTGPWVLAGWAGTGGTRPALPRPAVELGRAPTAPPPDPAR